MTKENLLLANKLQAEIDSLEDNKKVWEESSELVEVRIKTKTRSLYIMVEHVNFEVLKALTLNIINNQLQNLKNQFETL